MPSTRIQNARAKRSREMHMVSDYENMDGIYLPYGNNNSKSTEKEIENFIVKQRRKLDRP